MSGPCYSRRGSELTIEVVDSSSSVELVDAVVDVDEVGDVIGVEILGLGVRHPGIANHVQTLQGAADEMTLSFDHDADALYMRFRGGRSLDQLVRPAVVLLGPADELVKVVVYME